jgi:hypothetical protein
MVAWLRMVGAMRERLTRSTVANAGILVPQRNIKSHRSEAGKQNK